MADIIAEQIVNETASSETVAAVQPQPIVASQVMPEVSTGMQINPYLDWNVILGIPLWVFIDAFLILVLLTVILYWVFRLKKLRPVKGYVDALKMATQEDVMTWIVSTTKNLTIECLKKRDTVLSFYDPLNITKWIHTSRESVIHIGGKGGVIVSEDYYRTRDIVSEIALCHGCEEHNLLNPNNQIKNYDDYESYGRELLYAAHPDGLKVPSYSIFDPDKFKKYFPEGLTASLSGGVIIRDARQLNLGNNKLSFWEKVIPLGIIVGFVIITVVAAWMVPF